MLATIGLFDLSVRHVDTLSEEGGDLLQQEVLLLFCLKLARRNGRISPRWRSSTRKMRRRRQRGETWAIFRVGKW